MEVVFEKGSLSELITGKKVSNKEKVVIRYGKIEPENSEPVESSTKTEKKQAKFRDTLKEVSFSDISPKKNKKKKKTSLQNKPKNVADNNHIEEELPNESVEEHDESVNVVKNVDKGNRKEKREKVKKFKELQEKKEKLSNNIEELARTVFVGNVPLSATKIKFKKFFSKYGKVESVRFRCPPIKNINTSKKVAVIKGEYHPERNSWTSFVKFQTEEDAKKALEANGQIYKDHHLRVSICKSNEKHDENKAVFLGNLPLNIEDDKLWETFECCGKIKSIRIVRDSATGMGKGFAYVNFASSDSVQLALEMEDVKVNKKVIRIQPCNTKAAKKNKVNNLAKVIKPKKPKKIESRNDNRNKRKREDENIMHKSKKFKKNNSDNSQEAGDTNRSFNGQSFTGTKVEIKKKKKKDKGLLKKQKLAKKLVLKTDKKSV